MEERTTVVIDIQLNEDRVANELAAVNREMAALRSENARMKKEVKDGTKTWEEVSAALASNESRLKALKASQSALSSQVVQAKRATLEYGSSLKEQSALLSELRNRYQSLSKQERESAGGQELLKHIQDLDAAVKAADYSQGQFQRNVGNYPGAVQPLIDKLDDLTQQMDALQAAGQADSDEFKELNKQAAEVKAQMQQLQQSVGGIGQTMDEMKKEIKSVTEELVQMKMRGEENTEQYREMLEHLGNLKETMKEAAAETKQLEDDTSALGAVLAAAEATAGGFSVALGIMGAFGDEDSKTAQELAEAQTKLQSAIAITTGLQSLQNALQKESALMMGVNKIRMLAAAAAQRAYAAATRDAEAAQAVFNKVAKSNIYVWLAGIILTVVGAIAAFTRGSKEQEEQTEKLNVDLENQAAALKKLTDGYRTLTDATQKHLEQTIEMRKAQGASVEEIRSLENGLLEYRRKALKEEEARLSDEIAQYGRYQQVYTETVTNIELLERQRVEALRKGDTDRAMFYQNEINNLRKVADAYKQHLDVVEDFWDRQHQLQLDDQNTQNQREQEDKARAAAAAAAAKQRHEERIARIKAERAEMTAALDDVISKLKSAEERDESLTAANERLAQSLEKLIPSIKGVKDETEGFIRVAPMVAEGQDKVAEHVEKMEPTLGEKFAAAAEMYRENAQAIQEVNSALTSSFGTLSSIYKQIANDESKTEEERAKAARKAKAWSAVQIAANAGAAVAKGVASAVDVGFPAAIPAMATMTAAILSAIAQAKALLAEAQGFETGGVIGGYRGATMGRDNAVASVRTGEMVLNAKQQRTLFEIANGGGASSLTASLVEALQAMPAPVLVYSELQQFGNTVNILDNNAKLK